MANIAMPIIVKDDSGVDLYWTLEAAESSIEPPDIEDCTIYDRNGLLMLPRVVKEGYVECVRLEESSPPEYRVEELINELRSYLSCTEEELTQTSKIELQSKSLEDLIFLRQTTEARGWGRQRRLRRSWRYWLPWGS